jgi:PAS domain-containing protein
VQRQVELQMERSSAKTEAPSERAQRFANLLMLSYEPTLAWSLDGAIEYWNAGAEQLYGFCNTPQKYGEREALRPTSGPR